MVRRRKELTLLELQGKLKREPDAYQDDFFLQLRHFESTLQVLEVRPAEESKRFSELLSFVSQTAPLYGTVGQHIPALLIKLVERHSSSIHPKTRRQIVLALCLMRNRDFVAPEVLLPFLFKLFKLHDKELRRNVLSHIINDVKRLNSKSKNQKINSILQNYMYKVLEEDDITAAQYSLIVMIDLYRRRIWTSDQTVNIIAKAMFSKHTKIVMIALKFFLGKYAKVSVEEAEAKGEEEGLTDKQLGKGRRQAMHQFKKGAKKTRARKHRMKKDLKKLEKQRNKEEAADTLFPAIEVLFDPQGLAERLFSSLQKSHEKFEIRLLMMQVLGKMIACHDLLVMNFYPYLERLMEPYHRDVTQILLVAIESMHRLVPPEVCQPLMMTMANHFINDKAESDVITIGLNTVREMCRRQPLLMTEDFLHDVSEYKGFKRDKGVSMAAKSIIYLYRELHPAMLKKKDRGKFHDIDHKLAPFGAPKPQDKVQGTDLLYKYEIEQQQKQAQDAMERAALREEREAGKAERAAQRQAQGGEGDRAGAAEEDRNSDYEWQVSEEDKSSDDSGEWIDVSQSEDGGSSDDGMDESDEEEDEGDAHQMKVDDNDCPDLVLADGEQGDEDEDMSGSDEDSGEEEEDSDDDIPLLKNLDKLKLEAQKRQMLLDMQKAAAPPQPSEAKVAAPEEPSNSNGDVPTPHSDAYSRILTPRDFERIEKLMLDKKDANVAPSTLKRRQRKEALMASLTEGTLEFGTDKRVREQREEKRDQNALLRMKFKAAHKKAQKQGGTTNREKERRKATLMVKHKEKVREKRKMSARQKAHNAKRRKKSMDKFRIRVGV
eukprot:GGOE01014383.1.p1 GENE.GGOE01014383.1~~GGOE01014383.1.p1  ORF type:complete len:829 (+),score=314.87 GGOE01014383.1:44-2530(+)